MPKSRLGRLATVAVALALVAVIGWWGYTAPERSHAGDPGEVELGRNAPLGGRQLFPPDNAWNTRIDQQPVDPRSLAYLGSIGLGQPLHPDFGTNRLGNHVYGIPYIVIDGRRTPKYALRFDNTGESDLGPYPIPDNAPIEEGGDLHMLVLDREAWRLYEIFHANHTPAVDEVGSAAIFDLHSNVSRPRGWTSADAAGLSILAGLARADEVYDQKEIRHALRFTIRRTQRAFIYPARHQSGRSTDLGLPPMGLRLRLKADVPIDDLPAGAQVIARALQRYGMILADNGGPMYLTGTADRRWKRRDTQALRRLTSEDFEVVVPPPPPATDTVNHE